jgi:tetratricopeptide (TPR) repeat protein
MLAKLVLAVALIAIAWPADAQSGAAAANDKRAAIDKLLNALKTAPSEEAAGPLELQLRQLWLNAGTPAVSLLMSRGLREMKAEAHNDAVEDFTDAIALDPNLAEAYHQRALARFASGDTPGAIADLQATVQHEPRSFPAFETLANIAEARKDWKGAYAAWLKVLDIDPKTPGGQERLKDLRRHALGEEA